MTSREEQRLRTRAAILHAAAVEFDARGYAAVSISEIADRLGLTKGAIFFHFPSKAEIAVAVVEQYLTHWQALRDQLEANGGAGLPALRRLSHEVARRYRDDAGARAPLRLMRDADAIGVAMPTPFVAWVAEVARHLEHARRAGEVRSDLAVDDAAWHVVAMIFGTQEISHHLSGRTDLVERVDATWDLLLPGLRGS